MQGMRGLDQPWIQTVALDEYAERVWIPLKATVEVPTLASAWLGAMPTLQVSCVSCRILRRMVSATSTPAGHVHLVFRPGSLAR